MIRVKQCWCLTDMRAEPKTGWVSVWMNDDHKSRHSLTAAQGLMFYCRSGSSVLPSDKKWLKSVLFSDEQVNNTDALLNWKPTKSHRKNKNSRQTHTNNGVMGTGNIKVSCHCMFSLTSNNFRIYIFKTVFKIVKEKKVISSSKLKF